MVKKTSFAAPPAGQENNIRQQREGDHVYDSFYEGDEDSGGGSSDSSEDQEEEGVHYELDGDVYEGRTDEGVQYELDGDVYEGRTDEGVHYELDGDVYDVEPDEGGTGKLGDMVLRLLRIGYFRFNLRKGRTVTLPTLRGGILEQGRVGDLPTLRIYWGRTLVTCFL